MSKKILLVDDAAFMRKMVKDTGAHSTDLQSPESADHLCDKCISYAGAWAPEADRLWSAGEGAGQG